MSFRTLQNCVFAFFDSFFKMWGLGPNSVVHSNSFLLPVMFLTFCLLQNEKILCSSDFMRIQNMWKRMQARFGLFLENLGPGT